LTRVKVIGPVGKPGGQIGARGAHGRRGQSEGTPAFYAPLAAGSWPAGDWGFRRVAVYDSLLFGNQGVTNFTRPVNGFQVGIVQCRGVVLAVANGIPMALFIFQYQME